MSKRNAKRAPASGRAKARRKRPAVRGPYDPNPVRLRFPEPGLTKQAPKEECDINNIVRRFHATGELPPGRKALNDGLEEGDILEAPDMDMFEAACMAAEAASAVEEGLPQQEEPKEPEKGSEELSGDLEVPAEPEPESATPDGDGT